LIASAQLSLAGMSITIMPAAGWLAYAKRHAANSELDKPAQRFCNFQTSREETMPNDRKSGPIEISSLVQAHGITSDQASRLVNKFGNNRAKLNEAAQTLKARLPAMHDAALQSNGNRS